MKRSSQAEVMHRINVAIRLAGEGVSSSQIQQELSRRFGVSAIQAYRYLREARKHADVMPIPEGKAAFTVKLPRSVIRRIRGFAGQHGVSISEAVKRALEDFLGHRNHG
jgi:hypothetical protein